MFPRIRQCFNKKRYFEYVAWHESIDSLVRIIENSALRNQISDISYIRLHFDLLVYHRSNIFSTLRYRVFGLTMFCYLFGNVRFFIFVQTQNSSLRRNSNVGRSVDQQAKKKKEKKKRKKQNVGNGVNKKLNTIFKCYRR